MKIVILGAAGFVGSSLVDRFVGRSDFEIIAVDNLSFGYKERLQENLQEIRFFEEDLFSFCKRKLPGIDAVINCAAIAPLPENQLDHARSITQNVASCGAIVDFCATNGIHKIIHFSSSAVYENGTSRDGTPAKESDAITPRLMYPLSKYLSEEYFKSQFSIFDLDITCIRLFNLYGPKQDYFRKQPPLLGYLIKNLITANPVTLYASPDARRDYIHIDDLIDFIDDRMRETNLVRCRTPNLGSGKSYSVYELVERLQNLSGKMLRYEIGDTTGFWNNYPEIFDKKIGLKMELVRAEIDKMAVADISNTVSEYGWRPRIDIDYGLKSCLNYAERIL